MDLIKIKNIINDIKSDDEWVEDSHDRSEKTGVDRGLDLLLRHLVDIEESDEHKDEEIVDVLSRDFPKVFEQILNYLDHE